MVENPSDFSTHFSADLGPGSPGPAGPNDVERLLRKVPQVAFHPALESLVPSTDAAPPLAPATVVAVADSQYRQQLLSVLERLEVDAERAGAGGLAFLARTFAHFLAEQPVPSDEHPLIVALFLRGEARAGRLLDTPLEIGRALDRWEDRAGAPIAVPER